MKTGLSILIILILLPYVAVVFRTGKMNGLSAERKEPGLEEFVAGILPGQMPVTYEEEALKVQAVIVRTNLLKKSMEYYQTEDIRQAAEAIQEKDLEDMGFAYYSPEKQEELWGYEQWEHYADKMQRAAEATSGKILAQEGKPVELPYHAVSAGRTRDGAVLGEAYPYLEGADCPQDLESPDYLKIEIVPFELFSEEDISEELLPEITKRDESGYVMEVHLGDEILGGEEFRNRYGLNSSCFTIEKVEEGIRITTKGLGHGLGLSMYQANRQALEGKTYLEILMYFYKNVECISLSESGYAMVSSTKKRVKI